MLARAGNVELNQAGELLGNLGAGLRRAAGVEQAAAGGVGVLPLHEQAGRNRIVVKLQHHKGAVLQGGNRAHGLDGRGQPQINAGQLEACILGQGIVPGNDALLHAGGQHSVGAGLGIAGEQHIIVQRGGCLGTAGGQLMREHGQPLFLAHGGQLHNAVHELGAARNQRHAAGGQLVVGKKGLERLGEVGLVGNDAVDQAALGQLGRGGGGDPCALGSGAAHRGVHRAAAQIQRGK